MNDAAAKDDTMPFPRQRSLNAFLPRVNAKMHAANSALICLSRPYSIWRSIKGEKLFQAETNKGKTF